MAKACARGRPIAPLLLSAQERAYLERQVRRHRVARSLSERCRVVLRCADGLPSKSVAAELGVHEHTVGKWRRRFLTDRCDGLLDEARPGRPRTIDDDQVAAVIERTLRTTPADATHWSIRSMAAETGFSHTTIRRMWRAFGLQPHRSQSFKLSNDPLFVDKVRDIVGLYLSPPNRAALALTRKAGSRRWTGTAGLADDAWRARTPDAQLRAARHDIAVRSARCRVGLRHRQMLQATSGGRVPGLPQGDRRSRARRARSPHRHGQLRHPQDAQDQGVAHPSATLSYPLHADFGIMDNQVERWFAEFARKQLRRGVHTSVRQLEADIRTFIDRHNENPKPFKWIQSADQILASVKRCCQKTQQTLCGEL